MKRIVTSRRAMWTFISCMLALCFLTVFSAVSPAWAAENELQLYPTPHYCVESKGTMILRREATVVLEDGIDSDTEARLNEVLSLVQVKGNKADSIGGKGSTNIMVGVKGSHGAVDQMVEELIASHQLTLNDRDPSRRPMPIFWSRFPRRPVIRIALSCWARAPMRRSTALPRCIRSSSRKALNSLVFKSKIMQMSSPAASSRATMAIRGARRIALTS